MHRPRIVQAADAVAYLPLYVAEDLQVSLPRAGRDPLRWEDAFGEPCRSPPEEFLGNVKADSHRRGDLGCVRAICAAADADQPLIGICDPLAVEKHEQELAIIGGLIKRACFWCLTDKDSKARNVDALHVDSLFVHDSNFLTGEAIGRAVADRLPEVWIGVQKGPP